jgi:hypothetical protein|eukprot:SAG25_NODE_1090_length_4042_cov_1.648237_4_plen_39_part_00
MEYQLPRTSTIEMHYYHMTEVRLVWLHQGFFLRTLMCT